MWKIKFHHLTHKQQLEQIDYVRKNTQKQKQNKKQLFVELEYGISNFVCGLPMGWWESNKIVIISTQYTCRDR